MNTKCSICGFPSKYYLAKVLLKKYEVKYFKCTNCQFIETEKPRYWLREAYSSAIIDADTGIIGRNSTLSKISAAIFLLFCKKNSKILDYAGGYGIMTRMLRNIGLNCYWDDKYAENIFAKQFTDDKKSTYEMVTAFEFLEHMDEPLKEISGIIRKYSPKIFLFSTTIHNGEPPKDWWYFSENGGQHISLYTQKSLEYIALKLNLNYSTNGVNIHVFSKYKIPSALIQIISVFWPICGIFFPLFCKSKTFSDHLLSK
jgi:hypothetical protein